MRSECDFSTVCPRGVNSRHMTLHTARCSLLAVRCGHLSSQLQLVCSKCCNLPAHYLHGRIIMIAALRLYFKYICILNDCNRIFVIIEVFRDRLSCLTDPA